MKKELFKIIMQLHGEGEPASATPAPQGGAPSTEPAPDGGGSPVPANENNDGGSPAPVPGGEKVIATSEKGSFKLVYNERTGMNEVVSTMPKQPEKEEEDEDDDTPPADNTQQDDGNQPPAQQQQQQTPPQQKNGYEGNELLKIMQQVQAGNMPQVQQQQPPAANPTAEYTAEELQNAMRAGVVDENRIPIQFRASYYTAMARAQQQAAQQQQQPQQQDNGKGNNAQEFYAEVNRMAEDRAMKEIGITKDELDVAPYTDDEELKNKFSAYNTAVENNKSQILQAVDTIQRQQRAAAADTQLAYQTIAAFAAEMRQKDKNFDEIDKYMLARIDSMPHKEAAKIVPVIEKARAGRLSMADLPVFQEMYNQARMEYYSKKTGVPLAPQPAHVEAPGNGKEPPKKAPDLSALGSMDERAKRRAIGQLVGNMFKQ